MHVANTCTANSGGGVEDDGLNFCITSCGTSLIFGNCRLYKNFATVILFQIISPTITIISVVSTRNGTRNAAAIAPPKFYEGVIIDIAALNLLLPS